MIRIAGLMLALTVAAVAACDPPEKSDLPTIRPATPTPGVSLDPRLQAIIDRIRSSRPEYTPLPTRVSIPSLSPELQRILDDIRSPSLVVPRRDPLVKSVCEVVTSQAAETSIEVALSHIAEKLRRTHAGPVAAFVISAGLELGCEPALTRFSDWLRRQRP